MFGVAAARWPGGLALGQTLQTGRPRLPDPGEIKGLRLGCNSGGNTAGQRTTAATRRRKFELMNVGPKSSLVLEMIFAIKVEVTDPRAKTYAFSAQKTMYGGKRIAKGDTIFVFASENEGGPGLIAMGVVTSAEAVARKHGIARQTPRVSLIVRRTALAKRRLGRSELRPFSKWNDGRPETELNFKFYRQATNKIVGISGETAVFLRGFF